MTLVLTLRKRPEQRLDLSPLVPHLLAGKSAASINSIELQTTKVRVTVGDAFRLRMGDAGRIRIEGACERLDGVGAGMSRGAITVAGDVGIQAGRLMTGGRLIIGGDTGHWAASGMKGGEIEIKGSAGDRLGGPIAGEIAGMRGGLVIVRGDAGARAGDKMRRGTILIEGSASDYAGSRMIAGTLIVRRKAGALPGYLMKRGTIIVGEGCTAFSPTFVDCGMHALLAMRLMAGFLKPYSPRTAALLQRPLRRYAGDMAVLGKGELFTGNPD
ncbi:MAG: formylmethanofuran dehydrogenase subunit C [Alphaproteobacteria bacterium]